MFEISKWTASLGIPFDSRSAISSLNALERFSLVNCNMIGFVAFDDVLRVVLRSMVNIAFESSVGDYLPEDHSANLACFGVPLNVVAGLEHL